MEPIVYEVFDAVSVVINKDAKPVDIIKTGIDVLQSKPIDKQLKKTRDRLVHMKSDDCKSSGADVDTIWKALFFTPAPHVTVKVMIDHFVKAMEKKPG